MFASGPGRGRRGKRRWEVTCFASTERDFTLPHPGTSSFSMTPFVTQPKKSQLTKFQFTIVGVQGKLSSPTKTFCWYLLETPGVGLGT